MPDEKDTAIKEIDWQSEKLGRRGARPASTLNLTPVPAPDQVAAPGEPAEIGGTSPAPATGSSLEEEATPRPAPAFFADSQPPPGPGQRSAPPASQPQRPPPWTPGGDTSTGPEPKPQRPTPWVPGTPSAAPPPSQPPEAAPGPHVTIPFNVPSPPHARASRLSVESTTAATPRQEPDLDLIDGSRGGSQPSEQVADGEQRDTHGITWKRDNEPFHLKGGFKVGIIGGPSSGKSYLFHAIVSRLRDLEHAGALAPFLAAEKEAVLHKAGLNDKFGIFTTAREFSTIYRTWQRIDATKAAKQEWYKLRLHIPVGWWRTERERFEVEYLDAAGERLRDQLLERELPVWAQAFLSAQVLVFCLPLWVVFPRTDLSDEDFRIQHSQLEDFFIVWKNLNQVRDSFRNGAIRGVDIEMPKKVQTILALTMSDDDRCALDPVQKRWIDKFSGRDERTGRDALTDLLDSLRRGGGCVRYLESARAVSRVLQDEFRHIPDPDVRTIPTKLRGFGGRPPWLVPVSAVSGTTLKRAEQEIPAGIDEERARMLRARFVQLEGEPRPLHVELPLVLGLCEHHDALM
ncbi:MAG: hypothetical protein ABIO70_28940 [Pseudomonadota bacterium]